MDVPAKRRRANEVSAHQATLDQVAEALNYRVSEPVDFRGEHAVCLVVILQRAHSASWPDISSTPTRHNTRTERRTSSAGRSTYRQ